MWVSTHMGYSPRCERVYPMPASRHRSEKSQIRRRNLKFFGTCPDRDIDVFVSFSEYVKPFCGGLLGKDLPWQQHRRSIIYIYIYTYTYPIRCATSASRRRRSIEHKSLEAKKPRSNSADDTVPLLPQIPLGTWRHTHPRLLYRSNGASKRLRFYTAWKPYSNMSSQTMRNAPVL